MLLATTAAGARRRRRGERRARPRRRPPARAPPSAGAARAPRPRRRSPVPTATGPAPVSRPAAQPSGAASAALAAMRCHSAGISPGRCRARATASDAPQPGGARRPRRAAPARRPRWPVSAAPASAADGAGEEHRTRRAAPVPGVVRGHGPNVPGPRPGRSGAHRSGAVQGGAQPRREVPDYFISRHARQRLEAQDVAGEHQARRAGRRRRRPGSARAGRRCGRRRGRPSRARTRP